MTIHRVKPTLSHQTSCKLSERSQRAVLALAKTHLFGFDELELHAAAGPGNEVRVPRVVQQGHQELPELQRASALVWRSLAKDAAPFLLHLTWEEETNRTSTFPIPFSVLHRSHRPRAHSLQVRPSYCRVTKKYIDKKGAALVKFWQLQCWGRRVRSRQGGQQVRRCVRLLACLPVTGYVVHKCGNARRSSTLPPP